MNNGRFVICVTLRILIARVLGDLRLAEVHGELNCVVYAQSK